MHVCMCGKIVKHYDNDNFIEDFQHIVHMFPVTLVTPKKLVQSFPPSGSRVLDFKDEGKNAHPSL